MHDTPLLPDHNFPVPYLLAHLTLTETPDVTHDTPALGIFPFTPETHLLQHISTHIYALRAPCKGPVAPWWETSLE
jgi:hypothetical protein